MSLYSLFHWIAGVKASSRLEDLDGVASTDLDARRIKSNPLVQRIWERKYRGMLEAFERHNRAAGGAWVELGSGGGFFAELAPRVITSDIKPLGYVKLSLDAQALPFRDGSLAGLFAMQVFHHLPDVRRFLGEVRRCLRPGGVLVMEEPNDGWLAHLLFTYLHPEPFDKRAPRWEFPASGPFSSSNQALAYIVFKRDRRLAAEFPELEVVELTADTCLEYLGAGGVVYRQLVPSVLFPCLRMADRVLAPLMPVLGLHQRIVVRRRIAAGAAAGPSA